MAYEHQSGSDDGRFALQVAPWEARNSHWVLSPRLCDTRSGRVLFEPKASTWSADGSTWVGSRVRITLRKYPGDQPRACLTAFIECEREVGCVGDAAMVPLTELEALLDRALSGAA